MTPEIEKSLELVYEIEGLLHVMSTRNIADLPCTVRKLLHTKSRELARLLSVVEDESATPGIIVSQSSATQITDVELETTNREDTEEVPDDEPQSSTETPVDPIDNSVQKDVEKFEEISAEDNVGNEVFDLTFNDSGEFVETAQSQKNINEEEIAESQQFEQKEMSMEDPEDEVVDHSEQTDSTTKLDIAQAEEDEADTEAAQIEESTRDFYEEITNKKQNGEKILQLFTINDRYRFTKELFGGSPTAFNAIVDEISTFGSIEKVNEYLVDKQGINTRFGAGKEFLNILSNFYK